MLDVLLELLDSDDRPFAAHMLQIMATPDLALRFMNINFCTRLLSALPQVPIAQNLNSLLMLTQVRFLRIS